MLTSGLSFNLAINGFNTKIQLRNHFSLLKSFFKKNLNFIIFLVFIEFYKKDNLSELSSLDRIYLKIRYFKENKKNKNH